MGAIRLRDNCDNIKTLATNVAARLLALCLLLATAGCATVVRPDAASAPDSTRALAFGADTFAFPNERLSKDPGQARPLRELLLRDGARGHAVPALRALRARAAPSGRGRLRRARARDRVACALARSAARRRARGDPRLRVAPRPLARPGSRGEGGAGHQVLDVRAL